MISTGLDGALPEDHAEDGSYQVYFDLSDSVSQLSIHFVSHHRKSYSQIYRMNR